MYRARHGAEAAKALTRSFERIADGVGSRKRPECEPLARVERALAGFRAAPLSDEELVRRAGQLERFLRLVPIEYGRGVKDGRVTLEFEIQEAVTFRDGAAAAFHDLQPTSDGDRRGLDASASAPASTSSAPRSPTRLAVRPSPRPTR